MLSGINYTEEICFVKGAVMGVFWGIMIPFFGTSLGAAFVFLIKNHALPHTSSGRKTEVCNSPDSVPNGVCQLPCENLNRGLLGMAAGVMMAASVWSLLIPALELSEPMGIWFFLPAASGFLAGIFFLLILDLMVSHIKYARDRETGHAKRLLLLVFAVVLHNIPEGMAVGAAFSGVTAENHEVLAGAFALSAGIAIQNIPEGAIVSMPLYGRGKKRRYAFFCGVLSGAVEPLGAVLTLFLMGWIGQLLPFLLSFAAGAMMYVIVQELIPEASDRKHPVFGIISFAVGFLVMMILDVTV